MDFSESTKVLYDRIQKMEPDCVSKMMGYVLLHGHGEEEMIRLAFSPDTMIQCWINQAKADLGISQTPDSSPIENHSLLSDANKVNFVPLAYSDMVSRRMQLLSLEESVNNYLHPEPALGVRTSRRRSPSLPEFPVKICHYFSKGFCKHGNNCRYFHGHPSSESFSQIFSSNSNDDLHGPLDKLEMEIIELLKSRRGIPISIASLPMLYYEKYGRTLQAEGYLTESQRHGKTGYSLTNLLARLNCIRLIDRPHGQHSVIMAEDALKYMEFCSDTSAATAAGSRQIYLTFPAESTFTENDVSNYFNKYGPVQDVRIPCQQKRMFGFVTFVYAETVKQILSKGNPHFVCRARVLVKPYRDKSRLFERKSAEKSSFPVHYIQNYKEGDLELQSMSRVCDNSRLLRNQFMEENEQAVELERKQSDFQSTPHNLYFGSSMKKSTLSEANAKPKELEFSSGDQFNYLLDAFNHGSTSGHMNTGYSDHDSPCSTQGLNLPDSPFASPIRSGISTVI